MKKQKWFNIFYIPALILVIFFVAYPFMNALLISFQKWNGYSAEKTFVGIDNYIRKFCSDKSFFQALCNTMIYGFGSTLLDCVLGLFFAVFLNQKFPGRNFVRTVIYLPVLISNLIVGYTMYFIFQYDHGALNEILNAFGLASVDLLASKHAAVLVITLVNSWQFAGNSMIIFLAGLQGIPEYYYEAAQMDGASIGQQFRNITWPLLLPSTASAVVLNLIGGMKLYELIVALTGGGPAKGSHSLSTFIANEYFSSEKAGYAAAVGIFSFIFIMIISNVANGYFRRREMELE